MEALMIVKERDATPRTVEMLERRAGYAGDALLKSACRGAAARLRADCTTEAACAFIDEKFAETGDWAVIHDLRLTVDGHAVQLNHVLLADTLEVVLVDTRFIDRGLQRSEHGRCVMHDGVERHPIASPLAKMARDVRKLGIVLADLDAPRRRFGFGVRPALRGCVLVDPARRLGGATSDPRDTVGIFPRTALYPMLWKRQRRRPPFARCERLSETALLALASALAELHQPTFPPSLLEDDVTRVNESTLHLLAAEYRTHGRPDRRR